jgi:hypothetical protein
MSVEKLFSQLKGIHPPPEPNGWPLAPGWWIVVCLIAISIVVVVYCYRRRKRQQLYRQAKFELRRIADTHQKTDDDERLLLSLSKWLRQVSLVAYPNQQIESVTGQAWIELLDQTMPHHEFSRGPFTQGVGQVFASAIYGKQPQADSAEILRICEIWLNSVKPQLESIQVLGHQLSKTTVSSC